MLDLLSSLHTYLVLLDPHSLPDKLEDKHVMFINEASWLVMMAGVKNRKSTSNG
jgi:hypothetical protein